MDKIRTWIQLAFAVISNGYWKGFGTGTIYTGEGKKLCVPGLNCYSCPGALGSCPIGSLQATLNSRNYRFAFYVLGFLMAVGAFAGRLVCGWLCPFGWIQDLLYRIPFVKKIKKLPGEKFLRWLRFVVLGLFVIILPMFVVDVIGQGSPWFCKYICPAGTLEGGIPLVLLNQSLRAAIGFLYAWKLAILILLLLLSLFLWRPFCRYLCPLGAIYGLCNPIALARFHIQEDRCTKCGACKRACPMDICTFQKPNSMDCVRCGKCKDACPEQAITFTPYRRPAPCGKQEISS